MSFNYRKYIGNNPLLKEAFKTQPGGEPPADAGFDDGGIDMNEYDTLLGAIESLLQQGESESNILKVVKDTLGIK